ncbi:MAG: PAS domain-containing protein [Bacteroidota bacterium]
MSEFTGSHTQRVERLTAHYTVKENRVKYFSSPKERIFPRTVGIIGRKVQDCHPHESVDVVNRIIEAFRTGEKDDASFWIRMGPKFVLIQYFAVRDKNNNYKGVLEVSQEISEIRNLSGERKLLDW